MSKPLNPRPMWAIVGSTASGKTDLALAAAEALGGEIVSCDSVQVYRRFVIGCAKPTADELRRAPHHVIDVADWDESFDAQRYRELATEAIAEIRGRGREPILCGGTGLYLRALRWGLAPAPRADPALREQLASEEAREPGTLFRRLKELDPSSARATPPTNIQRIVRALEITLLSGEPASSLRARHGFSSEQIPMRVVALRWRADALKRRIVARTESMIASGLLDEVRDLLASGVDPECRPMTSVGYREARDVVLGREPLDGLAERIVRSTWAYARRQRTWLRKERDVRPLEIRELDAAARRLLQLVANEELE